MKSKLPPLNFDKENKKYKAANEKKDVVFSKCDHKNVKYQDDSLICECGAAWSGPRLADLYNLFKNRV